MDKSVPEYEGILLIDKDAGCTSHDVVDKVRRILKIKGVGHAGTLDPLATGLLVILVGRATKVSQYLMSLDKVYEGEMKLGVETNSQDSDGETVSELPVPEAVNADYLREQMKVFIGDQYQTPPMFSAKKINGIPLYKLARQGQEVKREPRFINISNFELLDWNKPTAKFRLACSKGTYVRAFARDLGEALGSGAYLEDLRRTKSGNFDVKDALSIEEVLRILKAHTGQTK